MNFRRVTKTEEADPNSVIVTLFLCKLRRVRGSYLGPASSRYAAPSVPKSDLMLGITALLKAQTVARELDAKIYIVDPENLWERLFEEKYPY